MKRIVIALALIVSLSVSALALAQDMILTSKVERSMQKVTKDGNPYVILFVQEERTLSGVTYTAEAPVFAFGGAKDEAAQVKDGDTIKAIVSKRDNAGDVTYTLRKIIR